MLPYFATLVGLSDYSDSEGARRRRPRPTISARERNQQGKPGTRRRRRYLNSVLAHLDGSATEFDTDEEEPFITIEWKSSFVEAGTSFFHDAEEATAAKRTKKPRRKRRSRHKGHRLGNGEESEEDQDEEMAAERYRRVDKATRTALRRLYRRDAGGNHRQFFEELEPVLMDFVRAALGGDRHEEDPAVLVLYFHNTFDRRLAHGLTAFHGLASESTGEGDDRCTTISVPRSGLIHTHSCSLVGHLKRLYSGA
mmetsp:Transcript_8618/g.9791  ORF Transcript_8618/g.9791 Transcript_8618/m.9791 type:complete len:253 (+) Transcript_8618:27-785(+)|eukprot:CAMPEP_0205818572 /NCGR_PEP_ID=MMETSP0206-20130828/506_1 /ASSEMBLY_ACC=CAM_ASM_000279 /TAXON_ID=36767 /ORGANISM="Euplotes focardii, Strain TN1" /LENGTH=252 /DNA_ID=CAMNT_0053111039 /DNA_START=27 /DNA_END=785 /DNA_ORIENTATION=+